MAVLTAAMESASVRYEMLVIDVIFSIFWFVCLSFMVYFYVKAFLAVRKWNRTRIRPDGKTEERDYRKSRFLYLSSLLNPAETLATHASSTSNVSSVTLICQFANVKNGFEEGDKMYFVHYIGTQLIWTVTRDIILRSYTKYYINGDNFSLL